MHFMCKINKSTSSNWLSLMHPSFWYNSLQKTHSVSQSGNNWFRMFLYLKVKGKVFIYNCILTILYHPFWSLRKSGTRYYYLKLVEGQKQISNKFSLEGYQRKKANSYENIYFYQPNNRNNYLQKIVALPTFSIILENYLIWL